MTGDGGRYVASWRCGDMRGGGDDRFALDVLVEWEGEDSDGDLWEESWVSVTELTPDLRAEARQLEMEIFGPRRTPAAEARQRADAPASRRADRRATAAQRQERERDAQQWRARASEIGRRLLLALRPARVLIDDFHRIRHPTLPP